MNILTSKQLLFLGVSVVFVSLLTGCKTVHTEIVIPAEPNEVWQVLVDSDSYKDWNPVLVPVSGRLLEGESMVYQMTGPDSSKTQIQAEVVKMEVPKELNQYGGLWGILTFDHYYILEPVEGGTKVTQYEIYRGIGVWFWNASWVEPAYSNVNEALRDQVLKRKSD